MFLRIFMACRQKIGKFTKTDLMALCPTIGKSSVENAIKKLIEEGVLVKHGSGRAACCRKSDAEQAIDGHERWYLVYGRLPRKFPNKRRFPTKTNLINR